jgi:hypothetical protein
MWLGLGKLQSEETDLPANYLLRIEAFQNPEAQVAEMMTEPVMMVPVVSVVLGAC